MGKRKEYRKIIKNYKEQKIVFQEEMKLDYSKLEETIAEAIKIEKERENENKRKHSKKRELLYKTLNIIFYMVLKNKLYITFFLSFYILSNVRKALFYRLYGHFYFLFTFAYRGISSYVFPLKRGKFRGKYFYAIRRFISVLALSIEECAYQSIVILILE